MRLKLFEKDKVSRCSIHYLQADFFMKSTVISRSRILQGYENFEDYFVKSKTSDKPENYDY